MDIEILIIASFVIFSIFFVYLGRKSVRLEQELKDQINRELAQYDLKAGASPIKPWFIGRNDRNRKGFMIRVKNNAVAEKIIFDYAAVRYACLEIDGHRDVAGIPPEQEAEAGAETTPGAQEYRKTQKRISRALLKLNFTEGRSTEISLLSPYDSVLGNLINIYNFFAAQADANLDETAD